MRSASRFPAGMVRSGSPCHKNADHQFVPMVRRPSQVRELCWCASIPPEMSQTLSRCSNASSDHSANVRSELGLSVAFRRADGAATRNGSMLIRQATPSSLNSSFSRAFFDVSPDPRHADEETKVSTSPPVLLRLARAQSRPTYRRYLMNGVALATWS